jgi:hypothetical protein
LARIRGTFVNVALTKISRVTIDAGTRKRIHAICAKQTVDAREVRTFVNIDLTNRTRKAGSTEQSTKDVRTDGKQTGQKKEGKYHEQVNLLTPSTQVASFWQGLETHSLILVSHKLPVKPEAQVHEN